MYRTKVEQEMKPRGIKLIGDSQSMKLSVRDTSSSNPSILFRP